MSSSEKNPLIGPNQLINSIDSFSESVTRYLSPVVRFVGHKDKYYDSLYRKFPDLEHEKRYSGEPAHLVVFDEIPYSYLADEQSLSPDAAYVFCLDHKPDLNDAQLSFLRKRVSGTLQNPTVDELYWHTKALLMIQDISFSNGLHSYPELMSVDVSFRRTLSELIVSSINLRSCVACLSSNEISRSVEKLLFDSLPSLISPFNVSIKQLNAEKLPEDRISFIATECANSKEIENVFSALEPAIYAKPVIALVTIKDEQQKLISNSIPIVTLGDIKTRLIDAQLIAYWCAMNRSSEHDSPRFYSAVQIDDALELSEGNSVKFIDLIFSVEPELKHPDNKFTELVTKYDRPSIDDIFDEAEQKVMMNLQRRADITDAASSAAGIPTVTFRKRMKRLGEKESFLGLISDVRHDS